MKTFGVVREENKKSTRKKMPEIHRCRRYLVWSRYEIIWVKGQTRILKKINYQTLTISFLRTFFVIFIQKTAEVVEK
jgi:hypothetical protein